MIDNKIDLKPFDILNDLWTIPRSITGDGVRKTLNYINDNVVPIEIQEFQSGMECFDWTIPKEWNIEDAYIKDSKGNKIVDFKENNLHILNYSIPINKKVSKKELIEHIYTLEDMPDAIPYVTSYYKENWGFCVEFNRLTKFVDEEYEVVIVSSLEEGYLTMAESLIKGSDEKEIMFSTYVCHPQMANNELSGPIVQMLLQKYILNNSTNLKYNYRFLYIPETIGSIVYLSQFGDNLKSNLLAGYVVTCVGDNGQFTYKKSKRDNTLANKVAEHILKYSNKKYKIVDFFPTGSDECQYCSPGFNLPVGSLMRSMYGTYKEYHTSLDNKDFVSEKGFESSLDMYIKIFKALELNDYYINTNPNCEPFLSKRGLYSYTGASKEHSLYLNKIAYLLTYSDGEHDLIDISEKLGLSIFDLEHEVSTLVKSGLLKIKNKMNGC